MAPPAPTEFEYPLSMEAMEPEHILLLQNLLDWKAKSKWPFQEVEKYWIDEAEGALEGGLQAGDLELFLGEDYCDSEEYSTGLWLYKFIKYHPQYKNHPPLIRTDSVLEMLLCIENRFGRNEDDEVERWTQILTMSPLADLIANFIRFESPANLATRITKIKRKLRRMPHLDSDSRWENCIVINDSLPGYLHPKDSAVIGVLGMFCGLVVLRDRDCEKWDGILN